MCVEAEAHAAALGTGAARVVDLFRVRPHARGLLGTERMQQRPERAYPLAPNFELPVAPGRLPYSTPCCDL